MRLWRSAVWQWWRGWRGVVSAWVRCEGAMGSPGRLAVLRCMLNRWEPCTTAKPNRVRDEANPIPRWIKPDITETTAKRLTLPYPCYKIKITDGLATHVHVHVRTILYVHVHVAQLSRLVSLMSCDMLHTCTSVNWGREKLSRVQWLGGTSMRPPLGEKLMTGVCIIIILLLS